MKNLNHQSIKKLVFLTLFLSFNLVNIKAQLAGNYSIGGTLPDYVSIQGACDDLMLEGISGAVTFNIRTGTYTELITLDSVKGVSSLNTITFQSETGNNSDVIIQEGTGNVFTTDVEYLIFNDLTFNNNCSKDNKLIYLVEHVKSFEVNRCAFQSLSKTSTYGIYMHNYEKDVNNITISNSSFNLDSAISIECVNAANIEITNSFFKCNSSAIYVNTNRDLTNVTIDSCQIEGSYPTNTFGTGINLINDNYGESVKNINITNTSIDSFYDGICIFSEISISELNFDNVDIDVYNDGISVSVMNNSTNSIRNVEIKNSNINTTNNAVYLYATYIMSGISMLNDTLISANKDAVYISVANDYCIISGISIDSVYASTDTTNSSCGLDIQIGDGALWSVSISNSKFVGGRGAKIVANYDISNILIDKTDFWSRNNALEISSYSGEMNNITISHGELFSRTAYGLYLSGSYYGFTNTNISDLEINSSNDAIFFHHYYGAINTKFTNLTLRSTAGDGIHSNGFYGINDSLTIENCTIDAYYNGFHASQECDYIKDVGVNNVWINNNRIKTTYDYGINIKVDVSKNTNIWDNIINGYNGIYLENFNIDNNDVNDGYMNISRNKIYGNGGNFGFNIKNVFNNSQKKGIVSNNFVSDFDQSIYLSKADNLLIANNSFNILNNDASYLIEIDSGCKNLEIINNIFKADPTIFTNSIYYLYNMDCIKMMDYNIYNFDTTKANFAYVNENYNTSFASIVDFNSEYCYAEGHSFLYDVDFVNDTLDLHINCADTNLVAGTSLPEITDDFDGDLRNDPSTIGADEVITIENIFTENEIEICKDSITLDAGMYIYGTYFWSTGSDNQSIQVSEPGTYSVRITDNCGTYSDEIKVYRPLPVVDFEVETSFLTAIFTNYTTGAYEYNWNFGDDEVSELENPFHVYETPGGSFTVELTALGECGESSLEKDISVSTTTNLEEVSSTQNIVYPNPSYGLLNIDISSATDLKDVRIQIFNLNGELIVHRDAKSTNESFDLNNRPAGVYFVEIKSNSGVNWYRIVLKK